MKAEENPRPGWEMIGSEESQVKNTSGVPVWSSSTARKRVSTGYLWREAVIMHGKQCSVSICFEPGRADEE